MTVFQNSLGVWVLHDGTGYQYFDSQEAAQMAANMSMIGETPAEIEIAATVTGEILPQLRNALLALSALKMTWNANGIPVLIDEALATESPENTSLGGVPVSAWVAWGAVLNSLEVWLNTPLDELNVTPAAVLMKRYVARQED